MKHLILLSLLLVLAACQPPEVLTPSLRTTTLTQAGNNEITIYGRDLNVADATVGGMAADVLASSRTSARLKLPKALEPGDYDLGITNQDGKTAFAKAGLTAIAASDEFPESAYFDPSTRNQDVIKGAAFLALKPGSNLEAAKKAIAKAGFDLRTTQEPFTQGDGVCAQRLLTLQDTNIARSTTDALNALLAELDALEPNSVFGLNGVTVRGEPSFGKPTPIDSAPIKPAALPDGLSSIRVAVLDSGVNDHDQFKQIAPNAIDFDSGRNFTLEDNPANPKPTLTDVSDLATERNPDGSSISATNVGHGTAVAAAVLRGLRDGTTLDAVKLNAGGIITPIKVCEGQAGRCKSSSITLGVCYATRLASSARPVKVMNLSLGGKTPSSLLRAALEEASAKGISIVTSAGNRGTDPSKPLNYPATYGVSIAGQHDAIPGLIGIASVNTAGGAVPSASAFSSEGPWVDLSAPGEQIDLPSAQSPSAAASFTGTSFSAPRVAGAAALLHAQALPGTILPAQVKAKLVLKARPVAGCAITKCGAGVLDALGAVTP